METLEKMTGFYGFLYTVPTWEIFAGLCFLCLGSLLDIRDIFEKVAYNNSIVSRDGDFLIIIGICIGIEDFKYQAHFPAWIMEKIFSWPSAIVLIVCSGIAYHCIILWKNSSNTMAFGTIADAYHNIVIVPLLIFMSLAILPFIWKYGFNLRHVVFILCYVIWFILLIFDGKKGRLKNDTYQIEKAIPRFYRKRGYRISVFPLVQGVTKKN